MDAVQFTERVHEPGAVHRQQLPVAFLLVPVDPAPAMEPPDLLRLAAVAQLAEGNAEFRSPCVFLGADLPVPDGVPIHIHAVVSQNQVDLRSP